MLAYWITFANLLSVTGLLPAVLGHCGSIPLPEIPQMSNRPEVPEWYVSRWLAREFQEARDRRRRRIVETAVASSPGTQWATSGRSRAVQAGAAAAGQACRHRNSTRPHSESRELAALCAATTCRCLKTSSPPVVHNTEAQRCATMSEHLTIWKLHTPTRYVFGKLLHGR